MNEEFFNNLKNASDNTDPQTYDGSYTLIQKAVWAYANLHNDKAAWEELDYNDLNLLLHLVIGTWKQNIEIKKQSVDKSHLLDKIALKKEIEKAWNNALLNKYQNRECGKASIGMFGTGFYSFETKTDEESVKKFIGLLIDIYSKAGEYSYVKDLNKNNEFYNMAEEILKNGIKGMGAASVSQILHCLQPYIFPILNSASKEFYSSWKLKGITKVENYIDNCREINKELLSHGIKVFNYRILDIEAVKTKSDYQKAFEVWLDRQNDIDREAVTRCSEAVLSATDLVEESFLNDNTIYSEKDTDAIRKCIEYIELKLRDSEQSNRDGFVIDNLNRYKNFLLYIEECKASNDIQKFKNLLKWFVEQIRVNNDIIDGEHTSGQGYKGKGLRDKYIDFHQYSGFTLDCTIQGGWQKSTKSNYIHLTGTWVNICPIFKKVSNNKSDVDSLQIEIKPNKKIERTYSEIKLENLDLFNDNPANDNLKELFALFENEIDTYQYNNSSDESNHNKCNIDKEEKIASKNIILYGPPGTGKTFNTMAYAVAIIEKKDFYEVKVEADEDYSKVKERYENYKTTGLIDFVTFHQSYGYEEFIEGIKPQTENEQVTYNVEPGVFQKFCDIARVSGLQQNSDYGFNSSPTIWKVSLKGTGKNDIRDYCLKNDCIRIDYDSEPSGMAVGDEFVSRKNILNAFINDMRVGDVVFSCYSNTSIDAIGVVAGDYEWKEESFQEYKRFRKVRWIYKTKDEKGKDILDINGKKVMTSSAVYRLNNIILSDVLKIVEGDDNEIKNDKSSFPEKKENYVFIIDEINRGNISKIFGELITLIEDTKREGAEEAMSLRLPYSNKEFSVPNNVYIIGTMNTADRSIAAMDTALRRRFQFEEMMPAVELLAEIQIKDQSKNDTNIDVQSILQTINRRIEALYDREHTIGHAYFMPLKEKSDIDTLADIFKNKIIPLLQEYFYDDYEKIRLVLGDNQKEGKEIPLFVIRKPILNNLLFGNTEEEFLSDNRYMYSINPDAFNKPGAYRFIYESDKTPDKESVKEEE